MKTVAIIGNPNCGKTTLFNALTGSNQKIGNWPGVTVEKIEGIMRVKGESYRVVDLPGIYSLSAFSEDELVSREFLLSGEADLVVNIVDASNLDRNLYLTTQLMELKVPMIVILNRMDLAEKQNKKIDTDLLSSQLDLPVIESVATRKGEGDRLKEIIAEYSGKARASSRIIEFPDEIIGLIDSWHSALVNPSLAKYKNPYWIALKLLEKEDGILKDVIRSGALSQDEITAKISNIEKLLRESTDLIIADYRYGFIQGITKKCVIAQSNRKEVTDLLDRIFLNRFLSLPLFAFAMFIVFWVTLFLGGAFIDLFETLAGVIFVDSVKSFLTYFNAPLWLITILADGAGAGIQAVASFVPVVFGMFFMLSLLEDSGYMARAAFIMDRFMRFIGLPGKSFVPLMIGFGCSVPAVMAARTLETKRDRIITVFMTPFMSCGARLSVYALFVSAFFPEASGFVIMSLYLTGIVLAVLTGLLIKKTFYGEEPSYFVMELPTYNLPRVRHIMIHTWTRLKLFIFSAGKIIVVAVMILSFFNSLGFDGSFGNEGTKKSVLTNVGIKILPVFKPFGLSDENWPAAVALFSGPLAKEAIVGTLNSLYTQLEKEEKTREMQPSGIEKVIVAIKSIPDNIANSLSFSSSSNADEDSQGILQKLQRFFPDKAGAYAYLLFVLLYFPCVATVGAVYREVGAIVAVAQVVYMTLLGWSIASIFYQLSKGQDLFIVGIAFLIIFIIMLVFFISGKIIRKKYFV
ncbi:MAG: ferrous iron transport protein B [Spirochaetes bacterium]|nr:ferrous iron transport protein B [Spirochaetota bacterium]HPX90391.1 ferrous iron transport protein B [Spirochaetota bacterium]